jgi:hypothetical protein
MFIYDSAIIGSGICQRPLTHLCSSTGPPSCRKPTGEGRPSTAARHVRLLAASDGRVSTLLGRSKGLVSAIKLMPAPGAWAILTGSALHTASRETKLAPVIMRRVTPISKRQSGRAPMFARIPRFVVIAAPAFFALTMASSANAAGAACPTLKCVSCQKQCYKAYQREIFSKNYNPSTLPIYKKQYRQCMKGCLTK